MSESSTSPENHLVVGERVPPFGVLPDTAGATHELPAAGDAAATVVVWTCNHCPYALGWHDRLIAVAGEYASRDVAFFFINSNDAGRYPADSPDAMRARVEAEGGWPAPYLHDATQEAARAWGAQKTPDVFVLDSELNLAYRGAPDADYQDESLAAGWLRDALEAVLAGIDPAIAETDPVGCSIKWKP